MDAAALSTLSPRTRTPRQAPSASVPAKVETLLKTTFVSGACAAATLTALDAHPQARAALPTASHFMLATAFVVGAFHEPSRMHTTAEPPSRRHLVALSAAGVAAAVPLTAWVAASTGRTLFDPELSMRAPALALFAANFLCARQYGRDRIDQGDRPPARPLWVYIARSQLFPLSVMMHLHLLGNYNLTLASGVQMGLFTRADCVVRAPSSVVGHGLVSVSLQLAAANREQARLDARQVGLMAYLSTVGAVILGCAVVVFGPLITSSSS